MVFDINSFEVLAQVYESLLTYEREDPETMVPLLAESWDVLDGGTTYTFTLRSGVTFHEGGTLEAVSYTHLRAHETVLDLVCRLLLEKKKKH